MIGSSHRRHGGIELSKRLYESGPLLSAMFSIVNLCARGTCWLSRPNWVLIPNLRKRVYFLPESLSLTESVHVLYQNFADSMASLRRRANAVTNFSLRVRG